MAVDFLTTLAECKALLKIEQSEEDARVSLIIGSASASILRYLKSDGDEYRDTNGDIVPGNVPDNIKMATIMLVGIMYENMDSNNPEIFRSDYLPANVEAILHSLRDPTLA